MSQLVTIGDALFDDNADEEILVLVTEFKSKRKLTAAAGQGDDDGTLTRGGREPREIKVSCTWPMRRPDVDERMRPRIELLDASVPTVKGQKPLAFGYELDGLDIASLKRVTIVEVEETSGPTPDVEKGVWKYEISLKSASPPKQGTGSTANKAGDDVKAWKDPKSLTAKVSPGDNAGGSSGAAGAAKKPEVKP